MVSSGLPVSVRTMTVPLRPSLDRLPDIDPSGRTPVVLSDSPRGGALQCRLLVEIADFRHLRRQLGCSGADRLAGLVLDLIAELLPAASLVVSGPTVVSCILRGQEASAFDAAISAISRAFMNPIDIDGEAHVIRLTFGAANAPDYGVDEVQIVEEAEAALAEARAASHAVTHDISGADSADAAHVARELEQAIGGAQLELLYQPKIHVRRQEIGSAEALVRWRHPEHGVILPSDFIPIAEKFHLIDRLTLWAIRQAIVDQRKLAACGHDLRLFINISGQLLANAGFVRAACDLVGGSDAKLGFEITETSVIRDPDSAIANLQLFADFGITIAIDDYGAGLSSLAYLKQLPARELKIDKLFVTQLTSSHRDPLIVRSTIDLAHALEMEVVAEGVETHAALALLTVMGCDMVQGFLISRPVALDALIVYLTDGKHRNSPSTSAALFGGMAVGGKR